MKTILFSTALLIAVCLDCSAIENESVEFTNTFNQAVIDLRFERFTQALSQLNELDKLDPDNPNIKYLMGVCLIATNTEKEKALEYLENAIKYKTNEYVPSYYLERRTPIYSLYYLGVCYSNMKRCDEAKKMFDEFDAIISDNSNDYVLDAISRLKECNPLPVVADIVKKDTLQTAINQPIKTNSPAQVQPLPPGTPLKGNPQLVKGLKTRNVIFHKQDPLYAVQIGAFAQKLPNTNFPNLKNVKSFVDKDAVIRYIVGGTLIRATAEALKKAIIAAGYKDAFIVDITEKAKFDQEVLNAYNIEKPDLTIKKWAKLEYKVQIGAYRTKEKMNEDMAWKFIQIEGIKLLPEGDMTLLTVGGFGSYEDARSYKKILVEEGVSDAFVIVYKNGQKTSTREAESFTSKDF
jgi:tetratricopeptide (TPR) repeat protein